MIVPTDLRALVFAAAFGVVLAAPAAQAFTFEQAPTTNADGTAKFVGPDSRFSSSGSNSGLTSSTGNPVYRSGNTSLQFGGSPSQSQRFNAESVFNPNGRPTDR